MNHMIKNGLCRMPGRISLRRPTTFFIFRSPICELGKVLVARSAKGICSILLGDTADELTADLADRFPQSVRIASAALVGDDVAKVLRYIAGPSDGLHLALDMRGTPVQRRIWRKLKAIPVGRTVSYMEFAKWISPLASPRLIASACAATTTTEAPAFLSERRGR